jgi:hypothetical protein
LASTMMGPINMMIPNSLKAVASMGGTGTSIANMTNYASVNSLRTRLTAANAAYFTATMLDIMSVNDMVYALRMIDDKTTISDYQP